MENEQRETRILKVNFSDEIKTITQNSLEKGHLQLKMLILFIMASIFNNLQINGSKLFYITPMFEC